MAKNRSTQFSRRKFLAASLASLAAAVPVEADERGFYQVDLSAVANVDWRDDRAGDNKGWTNQGNNDMRGIRTGERHFLGIPFDLINPAANHGHAVIALKSPHFAVAPSVVTVPVNHKAGSIYFLHGAAWSSGMMAQYIVQYADGGSITLPIRDGHEITNWWGAPSGTACRTAFLRPNDWTDAVGLVIYGWNNPHPDETIRSIQLRSQNGEGLVLIAAITLSSQPVNLPPADRIPQPDYLKSDLDSMDMTQWFPVPYQYDPFQPTPIDRSATLDAPAGKHGFLKSSGGRFVFEDGTPCRLVAMVHSPFVPKDREQSRYFARWLAKWGINQVRFHPLAGGNDGPAIDWSRSDTQHLDLANMDKMDRFIADLADAGIYVRLSMLWYHQDKIGDGIPAFDELLAFQHKNNPNDHGDTASTMAITFFDPKVMAVNIAIEKAIMTHRNPYRDNRMWGEDPAIDMIEVTNEDSMFFYTADNLSPYYKRELDQLWGKWLLEKYRSREGLAAAWGGALAADEDPVAGTVKRFAIWQYQNPFPPDQIKQADDQLRFYFHLNSHYFTATKAALRAAGVKQPICGTGWQGPNLAYWADLYSNVPGLDYIDRHHYWGGGPGEWQILPNQVFNYATPLTQPEIMLKLSSERVVTMPFGVSEWANTLPNQWRVADPALMAFYGQGLNGWDVPMIFAHDMGFWNGDRGFVKYLKWMWPVTSPETLCQYPALSEVIRRGDIEEAKPVFIREMAVDEVFGAKPLKNVAGKFTTSGIYETSETVNLDTDALVAYYAAAVGKTGIHFANQERPDFSVDLSRYIDLKKKEIRSITGQLYWNYGVGYVTLNTPRAQSAIGFLTDLPIRLGDCEIKVSNKIAAVHVTSWDGKPLRESKKMLITALGRTRNTGMAYTRGGQRLLTLGQEPILHEGIKGTVTLFREGPATVTALSPMGYKTADVRPRQSGDKIIIPLDGKNKAVYYYVDFG